MLEVRTAPQAAIGVPIMGSESASDQAFHKTTECTVYS